MDRVDEQQINYDLIEDLLSLLLVTPELNTMILPPDSKSSSSDLAVNGSVLIFLPGLGEIKRLHERLKGGRIFGDPMRFIIIPMHSALSPSDQKRAFLKPDPGVYKVILATNIAETSLTIPDCVCGENKHFFSFYFALCNYVVLESYTISAQCIRAIVIDTGLVREIRQDQRSSTPTLVTDWCSKANAKQRVSYLFRCFVCRYNCTRVNHH